jgi:Sugar kinases, ribokinase family
MIRIKHLLSEKKNVKAVIGFDGFVDEIIHVVDKRVDIKQYTRIETIKEYGQRISEAQGLSTNFEYVQIQTKLGGNGPILSNALISMGVDLEYIGALGEPMHPVFKNIQRNGVAHSICDCGHTDAVEFKDGKIIISKLASLNNINYENIVHQLGIDYLLSAFASAQLIGFENWTMVPGMTDLFKKFLLNIAPNLEKGKLLFLDLADPQKRLKEDIITMLELVKQSNVYFRTVLGLNLKEARQIAQVLGNEKDLELKDLCTYIGDKLSIYAVVIHPTDRACGISDGKYYEVLGPYCENPVLTTGAGDNFNAGLCYGLLQGGTIEEALTMGVFTSGFYVRNGKSPSNEELMNFCEEYTN